MKGLGDRKGWTDDGQYVYLMVSAEALTDMAPGLDDEQLHDLGWALVKLWQDNMQQDIDDLRDGMGV